VINHDAFLVMQKMFADNHIKLHISFPDPTAAARPEAADHPPEALAEMQRVLVDNGSGIYAMRSSRVLRAAKPLISILQGGESGGGGRPPRTNYEAKYRAEGHGSMR
jgi:hypothetical protein